MRWKTHFRILLPLPSHCRDEQYNAHVRLLRHTAFKRDRDNDLIDGSFLNIAASEYFVKPKIFLLIDRRC
jgi:hypothetical protein